jgi:hypothetical protein
MTVSELIAQLQTLPPDALVVAEGYEDGYDTIKQVSLIAVEENPNQEWYVGKYIASKKGEAQQVAFLNADAKADKK